MKYSQHGFRESCLVLVFSLAVAAQPKPQPVFRLTKVTGTGSQQYSSEEIATASGLQLGKVVTQADLQDGANHLGTSGIFSAVRYEYLPAGLGGRDVTVAFQVTDSSAIRPLVYDNFVWFSNDELNREVHSRVPLFHNAVPDAGTLQDDIIAALQQILATKGIQTKVLLQAHQQNAAAPIDSFTAKADIPVKVASVAFTGATPENQSALEKQLQPLLLQSYSADFTKSFCNGVLKNVYLERGFLQVAFQEPKVALSSANAQQPAVALTIPLTEGTRFRLGGVTFTGNSGVSSSELQKLVPLRAGDVANAVAFERSLDGLRPLYGSRGYLGLTHKVEAHLAEQQANFEVVISEGPQYHMGELKLTGLSPEAEQKLKQRWQLAPGAIYDDSYKLKYASEVLRMLRSPSGGVEPKFIERINDQTQTVNLEIVFRPA